MHVTVVFDWTDPEQRAKGLWVEYCLRSEGFAPRQWHRPGGNWVVELNDALADRTEPCLLVLTPQTGSDTAVQVVWQAAVAGGTRTVLPVCFGEVDLPALLAPHVSVRLADDEVGEPPRRRLLAAVRTLRRPEWSSPDPSGVPSVEVNAGGDLPRLRLLTRRSMTEAAAVGDLSFATGSAATEPALYVRRDIQDDVLARVRRDPLTVISGPAGAGKTSLLWGVAADLLADERTEVFFVRAAMLIARGDRDPLVSGDRLRRSLGDTRRGGGAAVVLIDTADVLVADDDGYLTLMEALDAVAAEDASALVTSRPAEAGVITAGRSAAVTLGSYSISGSNGRPSEYDRAVASHAASYCRVPGDTSALADQIGAASVRRQPLGDIARRPLMLRMLFELYAPGLVPTTIDATELFDRYWTERVYRDRRSWTGGSLVERDHDLTATATTLAHRMLRDGVPEVLVAEVATPTPAERVRMQEDVTRLCARGVGQLDEFGAFSFFHQTFFEYTAGVDVLTRGGSALDVLARRALQRPGDYFLLAVLEQTWLSAWRGDDALRATAAGLTVRILAAPDPPDGESIPLPLRRCAMVVGAQSALDPDTRGIVEAALAHERTETALIRDFLSYLPRPGRPWTDADTAVLAVCCRRADASWHSAVDVLARVAAADSARALAALRELSRVELPVPVVGADSLLRRQTRDLLAGLMVGHGTEVLDLLRAAFTTGTAIRRTAVVEKVFDLLDTESEVSDEVTAWADEVHPSQNPTSAMLDGLTRLHRRSLGAALAHATAQDGDRLLRSFAEKLLVIAEAVGRHPPTAAIGFCGGFLGALADRLAGEPISPVLDAATGAALAALLARGEPRVHEQIHHGWLVAPMNSSTRFRDWAADRLIAGLPASHRHPDTAEQRWADTVRRTLERDDIDRGALVEITGSAAGSAAHRDDPRLWTEPDRLLRILLPAACAEMPGAVAALGAVTRREVDLDRGAEGVFTQQAQRLPAADASNRAVIELLSARAAYEELKQLILRDPDVTWDADAAIATLRAALRDVSSHRESLSRSASGFLKAATRNTVIPMPAWDDFVLALHASRDPVVRADLFETAADAANRGLIGSAPLIGMLRDRLRPAVAGGGVGREHEPVAMRRLLVGLLAMHGGEADVPEMMALAFLPSTETASISALVGLLIPDGRPGGAVDVEVCIDLVIDVGQRLKNVTTRAPRDVAGAWKGVFSQLLNHADDRALGRLIARLPEMATPYAANLVNRLPHRRGSITPTTLAALDTEGIGADLQRSIAFYLDRVGGVPGGWPEIDRDLADGAAPGGR